jgi:hypothetical protein
MVSMLWIQAKDKTKESKIQSKATAARVNEKENTGIKNVKCHINK